MPHHFTPLKLVAALPVILLVLASLWPSLLCAQNPLTGFPAEYLSPPSIHHWFGTDQFGRDVLARVVYGSFSTLSSAILAVGISLLWAIPAGLLAGLGSVHVERAILACADIVLSIPEIFLSLSIITLIGPGAAHVALAVGASQAAGFVRMTHTEVARIRASEYIESAAGMGATFSQIILRHVLPNSLNPALALASLRLGTAILAISTICFLGYGPPPPSPEWGLMITEGRDYLSTAWWITTFPGLAIIFAAWTTNLASHAIRSLL